MILSICVSVPLEIFTQYQDKTSTLKKITFRSFSQKNFVGMTPTVCVSFPFPYVLFIFVFYKSQLRQSVIKVPLKVPFGIKVILTGPKSWKRSASLLLDMKDTRAPRMKNNELHLHSILYPPFPSISCFFSKFT